MQSTLALAVFALSGASAAILPRQQPQYCCFQITASGGLSGAFTQLGDGQNRLNDTGTPAQFCISNGRIKDSSGRGCIITPEASQFQCDLNRPASPGFSITSSGQLLHNGTSTFYGCPATDTTYNIYDVPVPNQLKCRSISLSISGNCTGTGTGPTGTGPTAYGTAPISAPTDSAAAAASSIAQSADIYYGSTYITPFGTAPAAPKSSAAGSGPAPYPVPGNSAPASGQLGPSGNGPAPNVAPTESAPNSPQMSGPENGNVPYAAPSESFSAAQSIPTEASSGSVAATQSIPTGPGSESYVPLSGSGQTQSGPNSYGSSPFASGSGATPSHGTGTSSNNAPACQTSLTGAYQTPHLIVPVSSNYPTKSYGTSYQGIINSTTSTIFNFDIPQSYAGKSCSIIFLFPRHDQLETSAYTFSGSGKLGFSKLSSAASQETTKNTVPSVANKLGSIAISPGNSYVVTTESCRAGTTESIELTSEGGLSLDFFEDWNPSSLGLYITSC
ncbi:hypothetical protein EJ03DRAFT_269826 [Teratosphaeria nubilosa]|uniref:Uncharacterized protein n=1 Tax=Teratosphaeria nubilosa TaxID=161662 RepID=A0A6G1LEE6_9PEZI|nr:hypothetical protein EJ03DRAFT_269826 [Teratosphaeria nubilosa]